MTATKIRVVKSTNYSVICNNILFEKNISLKAKGLLVTCLALPDNWDFSISGLCAILKENQTAVKTALDELKENGYLEVNKYPPDDTHPYFHYEYIFKESKEIKEEKQKDKKTKEDKKELEVEDIKKEELKDEEQRFKKPTVEEIKEYCNERKNAINPEKFFDYYESKGWRVGKNKMKDWKACVRTWEQNNFDKQKKNFKEWGSDDYFKDLKL